MSIAVSAREVRCPKCYGRFETMRRFQMACPECHHAWEEENVSAYRNSREARLQSLRESISGGLVMLFLLGACGVFLLFFLNIFLETFLHQSSTDFIIVVAIIGAAFAVVLKFNRGWLSFRVGIAMSQRVASLWSQIRWPIHFS